MMQNQPPQRLAAMASPTPQNPGGGAQPPLDPLIEGFNACIVSLKKFAQDAALNGAEDISNEAETMALRLSKRKLKRQETFNQAYADMQGSVIAAQQ
jgi:hypothetical protein